MSQPLENPPPLPPPPSASPDQLIESLIRRARDPYCLTSYNFFAWF